MSKECSANTDESQRGFRSGEEQSLSMSGAAIECRMLASITL